MSSREKITKEILEKVYKGVKGRIHLSPRFGKTKVAIKIMEKLKAKKVLWVTPTRNLAENGIKESFFEWDKEHLLPYLETTTWASLNKYTGDYDLLILDEEQYITINNSRNLGKRILRPTSIISMTGTPPKSDLKKEILMSLGLEIMYSVPIKMAAELGIISDHQVNIILLDMDKSNNVKVEMKNGKHFLTSEYKQYHYWNNRIENSVGIVPEWEYRYRTRLIKNSKTKEEVAILLKNLIQGRVLIFCASTQQAERVSPYFYHGKSSSKHFKDFKDNKINELALVHKGGTGETFKNLDNIIIISSDSDSTGLTTQKISRALLQEDSKAVIWILCLKSTQDEKWVSSTVKNFSISKENIFYPKDKNELITLINNYYNEKTFQ